MSKTILGLTAKVTLRGPSGKEEKTLARIDTGATKSSLDSSLAEKIDIIASAKTKVVRSASGVKRRPLVVVKIRLGPHFMQEEFTLAERSHMTYPVLIGQNILKKGDFLIDPQREGSE